MSIVPREFPLMSFGHCSCPDCGTTLRLRDRSFVGRTVPCPECHVALLIELDREENLVARKPAVAKPVRSPVAVEVPPIAGKTDEPRGPTWSDRLRGAIGSPLVMAWALGLAVTALVVVAMLRPALRFGTPGGATQQEPAPNNSIAHEETNSGADANPPPARDPTAANEPRDSQTADAVSPANTPERPEANPAAPRQVDAAANVKPAAIVSVTPPDPMPPAPPPKFDFDAALKQPLELFDQSKPVSRRAVIELLEELVGAPIRYDAAELGEKNLDKLVTFKAENTTLAGVLKSVLDPAGWVFVAEETQLRVKLKSPE